MSDSYTEYCDYYRARADKYSRQPMYQNSLKAEQALCEAFVNAGSAEAFRQRPDHMQLILDCALALVQDKETARLASFERMEEHIRKGAAQDILGWLHTVKDVNELVQRVNETEQRVSIEVSVDLFTGYFFSDFTALENLEVWENAEVPDEWKPELAARVKEAKEEAAKLWKDTVEFRASEWKPGWKFDPALVNETRHRRLIPLSDETVGRRLKQFLNYRGIDHAG